MEQNSVLFEKAKELFNKSIQSIQKVNVMLSKDVFISYQDANGKDRFYLSMKLTEARTTRRKGRKSFSEIIDILRLNDNNPTILDSGVYVPFVTEQLNLAIENFNKSLEITELLSKSMTEFLDIRTPVENNNKYLKY